MKYSVGQKVRVKENLNIGKIYDGYAFSYQMERYEGKIYKISDTNVDHYWLGGCEDPDSGYHYKFTDEMLEPADFTKDNLENGMVVEYWNGMRALVHNHRFITDNSYMDFDDYTSDLMIVGDCDGRWDFDIVAVYETTNVRCIKDLLSITKLKYLWKRAKEPEPTEMTLDEIEKQLGYKIKIVNKED